MTEPLPLAHPASDAHPAADAGLRADLSWRRGRRDFELEAHVPARGITALFGPSGAGKTSCLRAIAGLDRDCRGALTFAGEVWQEDSRGIFVPPHRRRIGYVVQEAELFPHLTVSGNIDYGFRRAGSPSHLPRERLIDDFGLRALLTRRPGALSGGERQRVAIVRALLSDPALLLFDEPLSALDGAARSALLTALESLHASLAVPMIYVSHSIDEVARLADHILILDRGRIVAQGSLQDTLSRSDLPPALADAVGTVIEGRVAAHDERYQLTELAFEGGRLFLPRTEAQIGARLRCRIAARDVTLSLQPQPGSSALNQLSGKVLTIEDAGDSSQCLVVLQIGAERVIARISLRSREALALQPGSTVHAQFKATALGG